MFRPIPTPRTIIAFRYTGEVRPGGDPISRRRRRAHQNLGRRSVNGTRWSRREACPPNPERINVDSLTTSTSMRNRSGPASIADRPAKDVRARADDDDLDPRSISCRPIRSPPEPSGEGTLPRYASISSRVGNSRRYNSAVYDLFGPRNRAAGIPLITAGPFSNARVFTITASTSRYSDIDRLPDFRASPHGRPVRLWAAELRRADKALGQRRREG